MTDLQTIHDHFVRNFSDVRTDGQKAHFATLIKQGLNLASQETNNTRLVAAFINNVLMFNPAYAATAVAYLSHVIANTGDMGLIGLQQKIVEDYELPQRQVFEVRTVLSPEGA